MRKFMNWCVELCRNKKLNFHYCSVNFLHGRIFYESAECLNFFVKIYVGYIFTQDTKACLHEGHVFLKKSNKYRPLNLKKKIISNFGTSVFFDCKFGKYVTIVTTSLLIWRTDRGVLQPCMYDFFCNPHTFIYI